MTSAPAIGPIDGTAPAAARLVGSLQGDAFSDLLGSVEDCLVSAAPDNVDQQGVPAQPAPGALAAMLAAMFVAATPKKGNDQEIPAKIGGEDPSSPEQASNDTLQDAAVPASAPQLSGALPTLPVNPAVASTRADMSGAQVNASTQDSRSGSTLAIAVVHGQVALSVRADHPRTALPAANDMTRPADAPPLGAPAAAPVAAPGSGFAPAHPVLRAIAALIHGDDRPDATADHALAKLEPASVVPSTATTFIHSPASPALEASGARQDLPLLDPPFSKDLDLAHYGEWLDQLAGEIARTAGDSGSLRFRLHPEALGRLHVEMSHDAAGTSIRLTTDTEAARSIIADAQPRLIAEARAQGVRIAEAHVALGAGGQWSSPGHQGQQGGTEPFLRTSGAGSPGGASGEEPAAARTSAGAEERYA